MIDNNDDNKNYTSFESAFEELKQIIQRLESSEDISLEELIKNYENGMEAFSFCVNKLEDTQKKVKIIDSNYDKL